MEKLSVPALSILAGIIFAGIFCAGVYVLASTAGVDAYFTPGATLNPTCTPGSTYCTVTPPVSTSFSSDVLGSGNFSTTGTFHAKVNGTGYYAGDADQASIYYDGSVGNLVINPGNGANILTLGKGDQGTLKLKFSTDSTTGIITYVDDAGPYFTFNNDINLLSHNLTTTGKGTFNTLKVGSSSGIMYVASGDVGMETVSLPLSETGGTLSMNQASSGSAGYLSSSDWINFNNKISSSNYAGMSSAGILSSSDWTTFNNKLSSSNVASSYSAGILSSSDWTTFNNKLSAGSTASQYNAGVLSSSDWLIFNNKSSGYSILAPLISGAGPSISIGQANSYNDGYLSSVDWSTFNSKLSGLSPTSPLYSTGSGDIRIYQANGTGTNGYLSSTDWSTFNNKLSAGSTASQYNAGILSSSDWTTFNNKLSSSNVASSYSAGILSSSDWTTFNNKLSAGSTASQYNAGVLSSSDWTTFNGKASGSIMASSSNAGVLSSSDWSTFNGKVSSSTLANSVTAGLLTSSDWTTFNGKVSLSTLASSSNAGVLSSSDWTTFNGKAAYSFGANSFSGSGDFTTTGKVTAGTIITGVRAGLSDFASLSPADGAMMVDSGDGGRVYFRYGSAWHYIAQTAGFQIPDFETVDPISGGKMQEGDIVMGQVDNTLGDGALHGVWVKWDSVKAQLLAELKGENLNNGAWGQGTVEGVDTVSLLDKVTNALFSLGISIKDGITSIKDLAVEKFSAKVARIDKLEMVDKATGDIYCTWVENGDWQKVKGGCGSLAAAETQPVEQAVGQTQLQTNVQTQQIVDATTQLLQQGQQILQDAQKTSEQSRQLIEAGQQVLQNVKNVADDAAQKAVQQATSQIEQRVQQQVQQQQPSDVNSVAEIADINVAYGIVLSDINLPDKVMVALSDNTAQEVAVAWDTGTPVYDSQTPGTYVFSGSIAPPSNATNLNNIKASVSVVVAENLAEEEDAPSAINIIQNATASLISNMSGFIKSIMLGR